MKRIKRNKLRRIMKSSIIKKSKDIGQKISYTLNNSNHCSIDELDIFYIQPTNTSIVSERLEEHNPISY